MYVDVLVKDDVDKFIYYEDKNNYGIGLPHGIPDGYIITQSKSRFKCESGRIS